MTIEHLRAFALNRSLFVPTTLAKAIENMGFVQADPIQAPARAQDLTLRHRVQDYRAGDLEKDYAKLDVEEDFFVNYGFLPRQVYSLMHPRSGAPNWPAARMNQALEVLAFVQKKGVVHPKEVDAAFNYGSAKNWFGGLSNASTQLLDGMHYAGMLRVAGRSSGTRLYAATVNAVPVAHPLDAFEALVDVVLQNYAPLPEKSLRDLVARLRYGAPQWAHLKPELVRRLPQRLPTVMVAGQRWYGVPAQDLTESISRHADRVFLLTPFDPVVWDRLRFELFWTWSYRFEAYTPAAKRIRGYYAMPLLWRDSVIGWGNLSAKQGRLQARLGYVSGQVPPGREFGIALEHELQSASDFLRLTTDFEILKA